MPLLEQLVFVQVVEPESQTRIFELQHLLVDQLIELNVQCLALSTLCLGQKLNHGFEVDN